MKKINRKRGITLEELLTKLRKERNWSYVELMSKLSSRTITEKDIRKWEVGLEYPDLNMLYELSEIYKIPVNDFLKAKKNGCENGGISTRTIKWICYFLNVSIHLAVIITILMYILAIPFAIILFRTGLRTIVKIVN